MVAMRGPYLARLSYLPRSTGSRMNRLREPGLSERDETRAMKNLSPSEAAALEAIETREWLESLDYVLDQGDKGRTIRLLEALRARARLAGVRLPFAATTPYINTIPASE